jgi:hypothetical protein
VRKLLILGCSWIFIVMSCSPSTSVAFTPTAAPTTVPTAISNNIVEDPPPCWGADLIYHDKLRQMLLVNCVTDPGQETLLTVWGWDGKQWQRVSHDGPPGRILGGVAYDDKRNTLVVYGGRPVELGKCSQETWEWDGEFWEQKNAEPPIACDHVRMVFDSAKREVILFSGLDPFETPVGETWSWNGKKWKLLSENGPASRGHFGFVYDPDHEQILLYGGYTSAPTDEFWAWKDGAWQKIDFPGPGTLSHFGMAYDTTANALYIFGGATSRSTFSSFTDKTWVLRDGRWRELSPTHFPSKRGSPAMGYDPERKRIILYGGFGADGVDFNDTWEWDGQEWNCLINCD